MCDLSGSWKQQTFKEYNFDAMGIPPVRGHLHPLMKVRAQYRQIFLEMGLVCLCMCVFVCLCCVCVYVSACGYIMYEDYVKCESIGNQIVYYTLCILNEML